MCYNTIIEVTWNARMLKQMCRLVNPDKSAIQNAVNGEINIDKSRLINKKALSQQMVDF